MKKASKLLALILALSLVLGMSAAVWADNDGSVTVNNATVGEEYHIYKVFDLTYATAETSTGTEGGDPAVDGVSYTYTKTGDSDALYVALTAEGSPFSLAATSTENKYQVTLKSGKTAADISTWLTENKTLLPEITTAAKTGFQTEEGKTNIAAETTIKWSGLGYGYYYVTSSVGATVTIDSTLKDVIVKDKNTLPTQDKKQATGTAAPASADGYTDDEQQAQVGDHVCYQIEVSNGKGNDTAITVTDTLSNGLTNDNNVKVYLRSAESTEVEVDKGTNTWDFVGDQTAAGFKIVFVADYVKGLNEDDKLYVRFSATVNTNAVTDTDASKENNTSTLEYSNQSTEDTVYVTTYKLQLDKVQNEDAKYADLLGARFELYRGSVADTNKIWFTRGTAEDSTPVLIVVGMGDTAPVSGAFSDIRLTDSSKDTDTNSLNSSKVIFKGLDRDSYVLHETEAPEGYNIADDTPVSEGTLIAIDGTIKDTAEKIGEDDTAVVSVVNNSGTELPSTGGIGTTIFYVVGAILVIGAGILLVSRKKVGKSE